MSKYFNDLVLPVGDAKATLAKVAMADQMGRELAKNASFATAWKAGKATVKSLSRKGGKFLKNTKKTVKKKLKNTEKVFNQGFERNLNKAEKAVKKNPAKAIGVGAGAAGAAYLGGRGSGKRTERRRIYRMAGGK